jgi:hypothetical protein
MFTECPRRLRGVDRLREEFPKATILVKTTDMCITPLLDDDGHCDE